MSGKAWERYRYILAALFILAGVSAVWAYGWLNYRPFMMRHSLYLLPAPLIWMLWLRAVELGGARPYRPASPVFCLLSSLGFASALFLGRPAVQPGLWLGVAAGMFIMADPKACWRQIRAQPKLTAIALIGASSAAAFALAQRLLWEKMCHATARLIAFVLEHASGYDIEVVDRQRYIVHTVVSGGRVSQSDPQLTSIVNISSDHFVMNLYPPCSGLEGVFLFFFLLSVIILLDWPLFKGRRLFDLYLIAFLYMFVVNAIRICAIFVVGNWAHAPDASAYAGSMRDVPVIMFHTWAGWTVYLIAFGLFLTVLYRALFGKKV